MNDAPLTSFAQRARWLSDISAALARAEGLLRELDRHAATASEVERAKARIEKLSREVDGLRYGPVSIADVAAWANPPHWDRNQDKDSA